jgi:RNase P/RNase MRP subunit POP5
VIQKEAEKILKYKDLTIEIQRMWNVKTRVVPVIIGATGTISKSLRKYVSTIPGNHEVRELQKLLYWALYTYFGKYVKANAGASDMGTINSSGRIAATLYSLGIWFVSGIYV